MYRRSCRRTHMVDCLCCPDFYSRGGVAPFQSGHHVYGLPALTTEARRIFIVLVAAVFVTAAAISLYIIDPSESVLAPKCLFYILTGLKCPGCGSQRALHALLHLNIGEAFRYNAMLVVAVPFLLFYAAAVILRKRIPSLSLAVQSRPVILSVLALVIGWWVARNIFLL